MNESKSLAFFPTQVATSIVRLSTTKKREKITRNPSLDPSADGVVKDTDGERKGNSDGVEEVEEEEKQEVEEGDRDAMSQTRD